MTTAMAVIPALLSPPPEPEPPLLPPDSAAGTELVAEVAPAAVFLVRAVVRVTTITVGCVFPFWSVFVRIVVTWVTTFVVGGSDDAILVEVNVDVELGETVVVLSGGADEVMGVEGFAAVEELGTGEVLETTFDETGATLLELALMVAVVSQRRCHDGDGMMKGERR